MKVVSEIYDNFGQKQVVQIEYDDKNPIAPGPGHYQHNPLQEKKSFNRRLQ